MLFAAEAAGWQQEPWLLRFNNAGAMQLQAGIVAHRWETRMRVSRQDDGESHWQGGVEAGDASGRYRWLVGNLSMQQGSGALCHTGFGRVPLRRVDRLRVGLSTSSFSLPGAAWMWEQSQGRLLLALLQYPDSATRGFSGWNLLLATERRWRDLKLRLSGLRALEDEDKLITGIGASWQGWLCELNGGDLQSWLLIHSWQWQPLRISIGGWGLQRSPPGSWPLVTGAGRRAAGVVQELEQLQGSWRWQYKLQVWRLQDDDAPLNTHRARLEWRLRKRFSCCELQLRQRLEREEVFMATYLAVLLRVRCNNGYLTGGVTHRGRSRYLSHLRVDQGNWSMQIRAALGTEGAAAGSGLGLPGTVQWSWMQPGQLELRLRRRLYWRHYNCDLLCQYLLESEPVDHPQDDRAVAIIKWAMQIGSSGK